MHMTMNIQHRSKAPQANKHSKQSKEEERDDGTEVKLHPKRSWTRKSTELVRSILALRKL